MKKIIIPILILSSIIANAQLERRKGDNGKWGFADNDTWIVQPIYDDVTEFYDYKIAGVKQKGKWGFIDRNGKTTLPFIYTEVSYNDETNSTVIINGKHGLVNLQTGVEMIKCLYDAPILFDDTSYDRLGMVATVSKDKKHGIIDIKGNEIIPCLYDPYTIQQEDSIRFNVKINKKSGMIDSKGKTIVPCQFDFIVINDDRSVDTKNGKKHGVYSLEGKEIAACIYDNYIAFEPDGFALVQLKGKYGLIDKSGKLVLPIKYTNDDAMMAEREKLKG